MKTRLTVILPVYNGMPFLKDAVRSVLRQSFSNFAFIIVDDGSTDASIEYLQTIQDPRIVLIRQANAGQGAARKTALERCQSEYVAFMDEDDISLPDRFAKQVEYLDSNPDVVIVGTQIEFLIGSSTQRALPVPTTHEEIELRLLEGRAGVCCPSLMFRSCLAKKCDDYPSGMLGEDIAFCLQMCEHGRIGNLECGEVRGIDSSRLIRCISRQVPTERDAPEDI
jgi:glycosyltransferase involved in cell wall biosynthesis